ncbi:ankyrin repeat-containing domain protein [Spinellus fusiger]|nr:ankyrin repeat-containing domain protein [Spinellus fusiger]
MQTMKGHLDSIQLLVKANALLHTVTKSGQTALHIAVQQGELFSSIQWQYRTILWTRHIEISKYLSMHYPAAITMSTTSGRWPLQVAASLQASDSAYEITALLLSQALLSHQDILSHRDKSGGHLLQDAVVSHNLSLVKFLLAIGANPNDSDLLGRTVIHHAAMLGHTDTMVLLDTCSDCLPWDVPDEWDHWTPLMHAARQGHLETVKFLTQRSDKTRTDRQGRMATTIGKMFLNGLLFCLGFKSSVSLTYTHVWILLHSLHVAPFSS